MAAGGPENDDVRAREAERLRAYINASQPEYFDSLGTREILCDRSRPEVVARMRPDAGPDHLLDQLLGDVERELDWAWLDPAYRAVMPVFSHAGARGYLTGLARELILEGSPAYSQSSTIA